jgi:hypothetical protein
MQHDHEDSHRSGKFKLKIRHVFLGILAALLIAGILHLALLSSGANRRIEALRATGQPTSLAELALQNKLPMGVDNAAPLYQGAFGAYASPAADVNVPFVGKKTVPLPRGTVLAEPMAQVVADCLAANEKCLALLHQAAGVETCRYDYDYHKMNPDLSNLRSCGQLLKLAAVHHACKGDSEAVVSCIEDSLALGDSLRREPLLMPYLVHMGCSGLTITALEWALNLTTFTDPQLRELSDALAAAGERIDLTYAMTTERCSMIECVRDPSLVATGMEARVLKLPGVRSQGLIDILDHMESCVQAAGLPPMQRMAKFDEIETRIQGLSVVHIAAKMLTPAIARISVLDSRAHAHLDLAGTGLAIERYRLVNGKLPEQLTDLVPAFLAEVPIDPFDGLPIRYRRTEPGYLLYSISDDREDNGGKDKEQVGKGERYDLCFIVTR